jgi:hypothetical protein
VPWRPESFDLAQRRAAAGAIAQMANIVGRLDREEFGRPNKELVAKVYSRVDDMLAMLYDDLYGLDGCEPQPPSAS